jgi:type II secretory pathway component GspD/PulD (secretin)
MRNEKTLQLRLRHVSPRQITTALLAPQAVEGIRALQIDEERARLTLSGMPEAVNRVRQLVQMMDVPTSLHRLELFRVRYTPGAKLPQREILSAARLRATTEPIQEVVLVAEGKLCRLALRVNRNADGTVSVVSRVLEGQEPLLDERPLRIQQQGQVGARRMPQRQLMPLHVLDHRGAEITAVQDARHALWWSQGGRPPVNEAMELIELIVG